MTEMEQSGQDLMYSMNRFADEFDSAAAPLHNAMSYDKKRSEQPIPMKFDFLDQSYSCTSQPEPVEGVPGAFILRNVITDDECDSLVAQVFAEEVPLGSVPVLWRKWSENAEQQHRRLGIRCTRASQEAADLLWSRVAAHVPQHVTTQHSDRCRWKVKGLHERIRFVRYAPDQVFPPHTDGPLVRSDTERSQLTCLFYLGKSGGLFDKHKDFRGGELFFLTADDATRKTQRVASVLPEKGMCVIFPHKTLHEGGTLRGAGCKYLIREDVMYTLEKGASQPLKEEESTQKQEEFH